MKNLVKLGMLAIAFAFGLMFIGVGSANAQNIRKERRDYRKNVREARQDYRRRVSQGNYQKARREYREDIRDARKDYRHDTGRRINNRYIYRNGRRYNRPVVRYYYRNGRRYVRNY